MVLSKTIPAMRPRLLHLTVVAVLWAASGADAQPRSIHADCGSVAFGGSGIGNTVKIRKVFCGIPPEQFEALVQERTKDKTRDLEDLSATQRDLIKHLKADQNAIRAKFVRRWTSLARQTFRLRGLR